jgi:hypothetical protein
MAELSAEELRESLYATWIGIERLTGLLTARGIVGPDGLASLLTAAEATAPDRRSRRGAIIIRHIMEAVLKRAPRDSSPDQHWAVAQELKSFTGRNSVDDTMVKGIDFDDAGMTASSKG